MLTAVISDNIHHPRGERAGEKVLEQSIEQFLSQVEKKAFRMAEIATQNPADALDIVQDAMFKLVQKYAHKPSDQWRPLFYRILQSRIMDYFRKRKIQQRIFFWRSERQADEGIGDPVEQASDGITPERNLDGQQDLRLILEALANLPLRQQQCFMLRNWEGFNVAETARAMGCSEGSVKTHLSRAKASLKMVLEAQDSTA